VGKKLSGGRVSRVGRCGLCKPRRSRTNDGRSTFYSHEYRTLQPTTFGLKIYRGCQYLNRIDWNLGGKVVGNRSRERGGPLSLSRSILPPVAKDYMGRTAAELGLCTRGCPAVTSQR